MGNLLLTSILLVNLSFIVAGILLFNKVRQLYADFRAFVTPIDSKTASPLAQFLEASSAIFARSIIAQFKGSLMGSASAQSKSEKDEETSLAIDGLSNINPALGMLVNSTPFLRKTLKKNPALIDFALQQLLKTKNTQLPLNSNNGNSEPVKFNL